MSRPLLPLLCGTAALLLLRHAADTARCSRPKDVANAHIDVRDNMELNSLLRYSCNPGYKRKAGTSSLIQCILRDGSTEPNWTDPTLQCIRDPAHPPQTPTIPTETTTQRGSTDASLASSFSPGKPGADGASPGTSRPPETPPEPETSTLGDGTTPLGNSSLDYATVSVPTVASFIGFPVLLVAGIVACCCWRRKMRSQQGYEVTLPDIPMVAPGSGNEEVSPPGIIPTSH